ncbi:MAG TPA: hypothetical protein PKN48_15345 [Bacteroidales bacterium]|nr:hypothetical protein [Bacteroidales bacterium]
MAKIDDHIKQKIKTLSREELEKLVLKAAARDKSFYDFMLVNYVDKESGEKDLYRQAITDLDRLFCKGYRGYSEQLQLANMLSACIKRINEFAKVCKNKNLEADLLVYVLQEAYAYPEDMFGTCFTAFDYKTGLLTKRLITLVTKKMHEDYLVDYKEKINRYLARLHATSSHLDFIYELPKMIE